MDLNTYLCSTAFASLCAMFIALGRRVAALNEKAHLPGVELVYRHLLPTLCIIYLLILAQFSPTNLLQSIPAIATALAVARLSNEMIFLRPESRWPAVGLLLVPLVFHVVPRMGLALY